MTPTAVLALTVLGFTSLQLPPLMWDVDTTSLSLVDKCNTTSTRYVRLTNSGRATLFVTQSLVTGYHFNGALQLGTLGNVEPGEFTSIGAIFTPGFDSKEQRGQFEILIRYHDTTVQAERDRIRKLAAQRLGELKAEGEKLEEAFLERFERLAMKQRIEHQRLENENYKKRSAAIDELDSLKSDYKSKRWEYEQGRFCSGCGQTESTIRAKGEQFPHAGEHVVPATPQQLGKLKAEYDLKIALEQARVDAAEETIRKSYQEMQRRIQDLAQQRSDEKRTLDTALAELGKKQDELNRQKAALERELEERARESRTVLVKLYGKCTP